MRHPTIARTDRPSGISVLEIELVRFVPKKLALEYIRRPAIIKNFRLKIECLKASDNQQLTTCKLGMFYDHGTRDQSPTDRLL